MLGISLATNEEQCLHFVGATAVLAAAHRPHTSTSTHHLLFEGRASRAVGVARSSDILIAAIDCSCGQAKTGRRCGNVSQLEVVAKSPAQRRSSYIRFGTLFFSLQLLVGRLSTTVVPDAAQQGAQ